MESTEYYKNKRKDLEQAVEGLSRVVGVDLDEKDAFERDVYKNAAVQKFEYSIELFWKVAKLYLSQVAGIEEQTPKGVIKAFFRQTQLFEEDYERLILMVRHRNFLSHVYDPEQFEEIYGFAVLVVICVLLFVSFFCRSVTNLFCSLNAYLQNYISC